MRRAMLSFRQLSKANKMAAIMQHINKNQYTVISLDGLTSSDI